MRRGGTGHRGPQAAGSEAGGAAPLTAGASRRAKLALLHYTAPPVLGGVESIMGTHARLLAAAGHQVVLIAGRGAAEIVPEADSRHPDVELLARGLAAGEAMSERFEALRARICRQLQGLLRGLDAVIAHNVLTMPFNLPLAAAVTDVGLPVIAWTHDLAWVNPRYAEYRRPGWPWSILHEPRPRTTYVAISRLRRSEIAATMRLPLRRVPLVPNGIEPAALLGVGAETVDLLRRAAALDADPLILVPVRITRRKRLELALDAVAALLPRRPNLRLVVSGPLGPHNADNVVYARELRHRRSRLGLDGVVSFLHELAAPGGAHPVDDCAMADLYRMADLVLLPSESEGFGLPVLEAGLTRTPLVCADIPVLREIGGGSAWMFPAAADAGAVVIAIERALASRPARLRRRVLQEYGWPMLMRRIERLIEVTVG